MGTLGARQKHTLNGTPIGMNECVTIYVCVHFALLWTGQRVQPECILTPCPVFQG